MIGFVDRPGFERHRKRFRSADLDVRLEDRVCLVTGANSGIGRATSRALAARGVAAEICGEAVHALVHNAGVLPDRRILTRDSL